jgi:hypothetical protein
MSAIGSLRVAAALADCAVMAGVLESLIAVCGCTWLAVEQVQVVLKQHSPQSRRLHNRSRLLQCEAVSMLTAQVE